ncbi:hypothetical protein B296_00017469 [Ensete ventricosum]|uniref:Uncharacterized protein n=1 Tax=Ensete ventricosum TaxID=4639 RepID=A0A426ZB10_ENSVE|nr:hypothetical protein B296_00017469 [Ensete ventricosum]
MRDGVKEFERDVANRVLKEPAQDTSLSSAMATAKDPTVCLFAEGDEFEIGDGKESRSRFPPPNANLAIDEPSRAHTIRSPRQWPFCKSWTMLYRLPRRWSATVPSGTYSYTRRRCSRTKGDEVLVADGREDVDLADEPLHEPAVGSCLIA